MGTDFSTTSYQTICFPSLVFVVTFLMCQVHTHPPTDPHAPQCFRVLSSVALIPLSAPDAKVSVLVRKNLYYVLMY